MLNLILTTLSYHNYAKNDRIMCWNNHIAPTSSPCSTKYQKIAFFKTHCNLIKYL